MSHEPPPLAPALPGELTIYTVAESVALFQSWLLAAAEPGTDAEFGVDGANVREADGAGLQLLASLANSLAALGRPLSVGHPSATLQRCARLMGLGQWLAEPARTEEPA